MFLLSALNETVHSIEEKLKNGAESALLYIQDGDPLGTVRFKMEENSLYFFRLSVGPKQEEKE